MAGTRGALTAVAALLALGVMPGDGPAPGDGAATAEPTAEPTTAAPARSPTTRAPTTLPPRRSFTLAATGDVLLHAPLWDQAAADAGGAGFDFRPLLAGVNPWVAEADLAICHLETPVAPAGGPYASYPSFSVPPEIVGALADTGYDACSTASNHTYDRGGAGVDRTLDALDGAGVRHAGSARSPAEAEAITTLTVSGADVVLLSYTFGFNGIPAPDGQTWRANPIDEGRILADAARARSQGAEVVVVAVHWGDEYSHDPNDQQRTLGPSLVRSPDIDLELGHHAHVVQPIEPVDGDWVVHGMGNLVAHHGTPGAANEEGLLVRFTFTEGPGGWRVSQAGYAPLLVVKPGPPIRVVDVAAALAAGGTSDPGARARLQQAWERTTAVVGSLGGPAHGLSPLASPPPG
jgi:poly-gamma-glutamate synthesis protein (capsule biosynthesis protein)